MTNDEADDRYGSVNIAENDSSCLAGVKISAVTTLQTRDRESRSWNECSSIRSARVQPGRQIFPMHYV